MINLSENKISSITCVKEYPEFNELKVYYYEDDHEYISFDSSIEYDKFLSYLKVKLNSNERIERLIWL